MILLLLWQLDVGCLYMTEFETGGTLYLAVSQFGKSINVYCLLDSAFSRSMCNYLCMISDR
jgi:hypothetical protein